MTNPTSRQTPGSKALAQPHQGLRAASTSRFGAVVLAAFLGAVVLYGVALSPVGHEVAHDTRHAIGFPCH